MPETSLLGEVTKLTTDEGEQLKEHELGVFGFLPGADPVISALTQQSLLGLGTFDQISAQQAGPVQQLLSSAMQTGLFDRRDFRLLTEALSRPELLQGLSDLADKDGTRAKKGDKLRFLASQGITSKRDANKIIRGIGRVERQLTPLGFQNFSELAEAQRRHVEQATLLREQLTPVAERVRAGLLASQGRIGDSLRDLPNLLTGDANPFTERFREDALISAQRTGQNPFNLLEQADARALDEALRLVTGEQAALGNQLRPAQGLAPLRQQGTIGAAALGAQQAALLSNLQSQNVATTAADIDRRQQEKANILAIAFGASSLFGGGGAGGAAGGLGGLGEFGPATSGGV